jgi:hypothetical protein
MERNPMDLYLQVMQAVMEVGRQQQEVGRMLWERTLFKQLLMLPPMHKY